MQPTQFPQRRSRRVAGATDPAADGLTPRQREVLDFIAGHARDHGVPPTRAEIARAFGFRSANAAEAHLRALARKGAVQLLDGSARGIRVLAASAPRTNRAEQAPVRGRSLEPPAPGDGELHLLYLPLVGRVAAGSPILAQEHVEAVYPADARWFARRPDYLLRVRGWSMRDAGIYDGDLLAVQAVREARPGQTVVARLGDEVTVKRLQRDGAYWRLQAANPEVSDIIVQPGDAFAIEGVVVGLLRAQGWD
ncbi:MAG: transcriptional repressor LexA [Tepidimonas sp.]|uniref:transcriptional repressor LexA n=1 Tax=Tepidimonas sp. TaxID=2002775 RepID=UPI0040552B90